MKVLVISVLAIQILGSQSFIIPDELPSILSVIYSNIPTIKKGTDSRIGWGFRLGDRADFQVLMELGPQTNTQRLANQGDSNRKRNTLDNLANTLYAQRQQEKKVKEEEKNRIRVQENITNDDAEEEAVSPQNGASEWLKTWSKSANKKQNKDLPLSPKPGLGIGEIDAKSVIPEDSVLLAQAMKKKKLEKIKITVATEEPTVATSKEEAAEKTDLE